MSAPRPQPLARALGALRASGLGARDRGAPHDPYFAALNAELRERGPGQPVLLLDLDRLDHNCDRLRATLPDGAAFRIVAKSLPCPRLLDHVMRRFETDRLMVFHAPHITALAQHFPGVDLLLGKPMPVAAARACYRQLDDLDFDPARRLTWLIDTVDRLEQYLELARENGRTLRISLEIDVGLHRGGFDGPEALSPALDRIAAAPEHVELCGLMGYDAHVGKLPAWLAERDASLAQANARYQACVDWVRARYPTLASRPLTLNGAGSPTLRLHGRGTPLNELAAGSCLVLPADFEQPLLGDLMPAAFIATPVLKALEGAPIPGVERLSPLLSAVDPNREMTFFIYGGGWRARCVSPQGLTDNALFGFSTNQASLWGSRRTGLRVDDHVFLQPQQSELLLSAFGDIAVFRAGKLVDTWSPLSG